MRALLLLTLGACALTSRSTPEDIQYFTPEVAATAPRTTTTTATTARSTPRVRLGRVTAPTHLRDQIAARTSEVQVGHYYGRRWTESPEIYVRRALARALFHELGLVEAVRGDALTLDVELIAFEELRGPPLGGHVRLAYRLSDGDTVVDSGQVDIRHPACDARFGSVVTAIGAALAEASARIGDVVATELGAPRLAPAIATSATCGPPVVGAR